MVKKIALILGILAMLIASVAVCQGYTVSKWPPPGIPNTVYCGGSPCLGGPGGADRLVLKGPVAPACEPPLLPGIIHAGFSIPFRAVSVVAAPVFAGYNPTDECCACELGEPAYVTAAVPCTPVNAYVPPCGW
jgi:hypothetical protein